MTHDSSRRLFLRAAAWSLPGLAALRLEASGAPSSELTLVSHGEPGRHLLVEGRVVGVHGAPVAGARLFVYHTDSDGYYSRPVNDPRRARIRGTVVTDDGGAYRLRTIVPGNYFDRPQAAHIHVHLAGGALPDHWVESFLFEGDPHLRSADLSLSRSRGRFGHVLSLRRGGQGPLLASRDIVLDPGVAERNRLVNGWYAR
jgi:Dioxygenase